MNGLDDDEGRRLHEWIVEGSYTRPSRDMSGWHRDLIPARWRPGFARFTVGVRWTFAGLLVASAPYFVSLFLGADAIETVRRAAPILGLGRNGWVPFYILLACTTGLWLGSARLITKQRYLSAVRLLQPATFLLFANMEIWHIHRGSELRTVAPFVFWVWTLFGLATGVLGLMQLKREPSSASSEGGGKNIPGRPASRM